MLKNADVRRRKISNISDLCYSNLIVINNLTLLSFNKSLVKYSDPMYDLQWILGFSDLALLNYLREMKIVLTSDMNRLDI